MLNLLNKLWSLEESTFIYICNSIFIGIFFLTVFFIIILIKQKHLPKLPYKREFINKNHVNVLYSHNWSEEELPVVLILPGNPGQAGFYLEYMDLLVEECQDEFRACVVSHVGHSPSSDKTFNVRDQVSQTRAIIIPFQIVRGQEFNQNHKNGNSCTEE